MPLLLVAASAAGCSDPMGGDSFHVRTAWRLDGCTVFWHAAASDSGTPNARQVTLRYRMNDAPELTATFHGAYLGPSVLGGTDFQDPLFVNPGVTLYPYRVWSYEAEGYTRKDSVNFRTSTATGCATV